MPLDPQADMILGLVKRANLPELWQLTPDQAREPAVATDPLAAALVAARALVDGGRPAAAVERQAVLEQAHPRGPRLTGLAL